LHVTTRRFFIGPIPEGWLNSNRKSWYRKHLLQTDSRSRYASFTAATHNTQLRACSGLEGPQAVARHRLHFPQPEDVADHGIRGRSVACIDEEDEDGEGEGEDQNEVEDESDEDSGRAAPQEIAPVSTDEENPQQVSGSTDEASSTAPKMIPAPSDTGADHLSNVENGRQERIGQSSVMSAEPSSFVTAREGPGTDESRSRAHTDSPGYPSLPQDAVDQAGKVVEISRSTSNADSLPGSDQLHLTKTASLRQASSTTALLPGRDDEEDLALSIASPRSLHLRSPDPTRETETGSIAPLRTPASGIRFKIPDGVAMGQQRLARRVTSAQKRAGSVQLRRSTLQEGAVIKLEKMLVRIDVTHQPVSEDYDENAAMKTETRIVEKWREYMVVIRQSSEDEADLRLQLYKSRVIPQFESANVKHRPQHEVLLSPKTTRVNLYSSLDKTMVIWHPHKKGTRIIVARTQATPHSVEWYTFLRDSVGCERPSKLQVSVPDLGVSVRLERPFERFEAAKDLVRDANHDGGLARVQEEEEAVAGKIVDQCMEMLQDAPEWAGVLDEWASAERMGLAWRRYDRLEWVHGANEQKMYGSMAMQKSHELELRPKKHYATHCYGKEGERYDEPAPVEGFLIRLTAQKGSQQRFGRAYYKRLYFSSHGQFLVFNQPSKITPPHPPRLSTLTGTNVPSTSEIINKTPKMYDIEPFAVKDGRFTWRVNTPGAVKDYDRKAAEEARRNLDNLSHCDGYINLCRVARVRKMRWGASPTDDRLDSGSDVDFHQEVADTRREDGATKKVDDHRTFELVLENGLIIRLQAYDEATMQEWIKRLGRLVKYWKLRIVAELNVLKQIRKSNLANLNIDEEMEALIGQFARKWEVSRCQASAQLYHMCGISACRAIVMAGLLYRKARRRGTFKRCSVILANGTLMVFQASLRKFTGEQLASIHQQKEASIGLDDCYIYSGLITQDDLLYSNRTFDNNNPGRRGALPRIYPTDGWTSIDQDTMTCFVIWQSRRKSYFRSTSASASVSGPPPSLPPNPVTPLTNTTTATNTTTFTNPFSTTPTTTLPSTATPKTKSTASTNTITLPRHFAALGVPGRSIVFRCRSRAERDHWVMNIGMEIDRLQALKGAGAGAGVGAGGGGVAEDGGV
jgi:hypothetical protein